jgi:hypothetical protein
MGMLVRRHYTSVDTEVKSEGATKKVAPSVDKVEEVKKPKKTTKEK